MNRSRIMFSLRITNLSDVAVVRWSSTAQQFVDRMLADIGSGNTLPFNISLGSSSPVQPTLITVNPTTIINASSLSTGAAAGLAIGLFFLGVLMTLLINLAVLVACRLYKQRHHFVDLSKNVAVDYERQSDEVKLNDD